MARRIPFIGVVPYMTGRIQVTGYRPADASRFAVVRTSSKAPWDLIHVRTGMSVGSLLPALSRPITLAEKLNVAASFHAMASADWSAFDELPELGASSNAKARLDPAKAGPVLADMRAAVYALFEGA